jgi:hypothetical protein
MKLSYKFQRSSILDHQDGWCIANKQRGTTLHHVVRRQKTIREELEFASPMNTKSSTKDQQKLKRLMEEEHAIVCILISKIEWCTEKLKARRGPAQWT